MVMNCEKTTIWIYKLPESTTVDEVKLLVQEIGQVISIKNHMLFLFFHN